MSYSECKSTIEDVSYVWAEPKSEQLPGSKHNGAGSSQENLNEKFLQVQERFLKPFHKITIGQLNKAWKVTEANANE